MNEKIIKTILIAFGLLLVAIFFLIFSLNRRISVLMADPSVKSSSQTAEKTADSIKNLKLNQDITKIMGKIIEKGDGYFVISFNLPDFTRPKPKDVSDPQKSVSSDDCEKITKNVKVDVNENTVFVSKKFADFQVGAMISIETDKSIIGNDEVLAVKISEPKARY